MRSCRRIGNGFSRSVRLVLRFQKAWWPIGLNRATERSSHRLQESGVQVAPGMATGDRKKSPLAGKTFVFTGGLDHFTRDGAQQAVEAAGARVSSSVSKKTSYVVVGRDPGSKLDQARTLGVTILTEAGVCFPDWEGRERA